MAAIWHETQSRSGDWSESGSNMKIACLHFFKGSAFGSAFWWVLLALGAGLSILTFGLHTLGSLPYCETRSNAPDVGVSIAALEKANARV